jgi:hypothetical protein
MQFHKSKIPGILRPTLREERNFHSHSALQHRFVVSEFGAGKLDNWAVLSDSYVAPGQSWAGAETSEHIKRAYGRTLDA